MCVWEGGVESEMFGWQHGLYILTFQLCMLGCPLSFTSMSCIADIYPVVYEGSQSSTCQVVFEVTSAEVIKDPRSVSVLPGHSSHVVSWSQSFC